jgi:hypothetical protein
VEAEETREIQSFGDGLLTTSRAFLAVIRWHAIGARLYTEYPAKHAHCGQTGSAVAQPRVLSSHCHRAGLALPEICRFKFRVSAFRRFRLRHALHCPEGLLDYQPTMRATRICRQAQQAGAQRLQYAIGLSYASKASPPFIPAGSQPEPYGFAGQPSKLGRWVDGMLNLRAGRGELSGGVEGGWTDAMQVESKRWGAGEDFFALVDNGGYVSAVVKRCSIAHVAKERT